MNRFIFIYFLIILISPAYPQYLGGNEDGFSLVESGQISVNDQVFYCAGGNDDGFALINKSFSPMNGQDLYCSGGTGDGYSRLSLAELPMNAQAFYSAGGNDDGFDRKSISSYLFNSALCYGGGENDGFSGQSGGFATFFDQAFYLAGGNDDGFSRLSNDPVTLNNQAFYVTGGIHDGFSDAYSGNLNICNTSIYASGGIGDGFHNSKYSGPMVFSSAWNGGISDGFSLTGIFQGTFSPNFYCMGGVNDGGFSLHMPLSYFGPGIWLGLANSSWNESSNWSGNRIPDLSVDVLISAGKQYYPLILSGNLAINNTSANNFCKSLTIGQGGLLINKAALFLYGDMTISGLYQGDDENNNQVFIYPGGNLIIKPLGEMNIGKP